MMAHHGQQDVREVSQLIQALESSKDNRRGSGKSGYSCKKQTYKVDGTLKTFVDSWKFNDWDFAKDDLPTYARGLFTSKRSDGNNEIVIRGYDKFHNVGELPRTQWENIQQHTVGPYELSVKENGCIIFMSGLEDGKLLVCSKHSTGARGDPESSHAVVGEKWVDRHLASVGKTKTDLAKYLRENNVTAVGELCDDSFEEHVLAYPPEMAGLYIHGINLNLPDFATWSGAEVHDFATTWGFKKAEYTMIQGIDEVKQFLERCAETGSWDGRDTEGFVVRCHVKGPSGRSRSNWFFKYKFEEPYLMYRQWRECTKAVIAGRPPKIRKHQKVTEEYLVYARRQFAKDPKLTKLYNLNHGIIAMRDGFLAEKGVKGSDIIAEELNADRSETEPTHNILLVPIATIGCGKTTVATALVKLFGFGHVQNDNIQGTKNRPGRFTVAITSSMLEYPAVIADRNNHQKREREQIIKDVQRIVPETKFVALHWVHEPKEKLAQHIRNVTARRVLDRGDNHQTIHAGTKGEHAILSIMDGFLSRFEGLNTNHEPDANFDEVINLDPTASSRENLEIIITHLYNAYPKLFTGDMPTHQDMDDAIAFALGTKVELQHDLSFNKRDNQTRQSEVRVERKESTPPAPLTAEQRVKRIEYFCIPVSHTVINSTLTHLFAHATREQAQMYQSLKQNGRIQVAFHVTLCHRSAALTHSDTWARYAQAYTQKLTDPSKKQDDRMPSLGPARVRLERLVWDGRVMAFVVTILPSDNGFGWECANDIAHITVGTAEPSIKPKESNDMLQTWIQGGDGSSQIFELEVPGMKVLEGAVKPVMQRGR